MSNVKSWFDKAATLLKTETDLPDWLKEPTELELESKERHPCHSFNKRDILEYFNRRVFSLLPGVECWVAGGAVRQFCIQGNTNDTDIDLFFPNEEELRKALNLLDVDKEVEVQETKFAYNIGHLDLVKRTFKHPQEIIDDFDFTVCAIAVDRTSVTFHEDFRRDIEHREIILNHATDPIRNLLRVLKYTKKGFNIPEYELLKIVQGIMKIKEGDETEAHRWY